MITVVIPALNESETISYVINLARKSSLVSEILVIDDGSIDGTPELALAAGAQVITSTMLGKGVSMDDGLRAAKNEFLIYLDGDLQGLSDDLIEKMTKPLIANEADFVKAKFSRSAGRVTALTAKPLLKTYFPELSHFEQPLSGIMAGRRSLLEQITFENDYGVDIGLLIDCASVKARLVEVDIGHLQHESQTLEALEEMAIQVARTILDRAARWGRLRPSFVHEVREKERFKKAALATTPGHIKKAEQLALFDMDGVLLNGRFIVALAERTGKTSELSEFLDNHDLNPDERTRRIGMIFKNVPREVFEATAREIPLMPGAVETVVGLRKAGYRVGIVTDSFRIAAEVVRRRVFADFSFANMMRFKAGKATGQVTLAPAMLLPNGCPEHKYCKKNVLLRLTEMMEIGADRVLAVGDGTNDICMLRAAGLSVAFQPKSPAVREAAQIEISDSLLSILALVQKQTGENQEQ